MKTDIYKRAVEAYGQDAQLNVLIEECAELIVAVNHYRRGKCMLSEVLSEAADVKIMIKQLSKMFNVDLDQYEKEKLKKLERRLNEKN